MTGGNTKISKSEVENRIMGILCDQRLVKKTLASTLLSASEGLRTSDIDDENKEFEKFLLDGINSPLISLRESDLDKRCYGIPSKLCTKAKRELKEQGFIGDTHTENFEKAYFLTTEGQTEYYRRIGESQNEDN